MKKVTSARRIVTGVVLALSACMPSNANEAGEGELLTRAERTGFQETSRYEEVVEIMRAAADTDPRMKLTTFGYTNEARALPMMVVGDVPDASPGSVRESGKTVVYLQGNIHAGEVCGKEALLMLLREITEGRHDGWLDDLVLLVAPIYNADGNERFDLNNRGTQNGPLGGMGVRTNAQGLDLNRDHMKLASPEARSVARMVTEYAPHVTMDFHTTNGSYHAYHVTYAPPLHPNTDEAITTYLRGELLPAITDAIREKHGWYFYYYGNTGGSGADGLPRWATFDSRPRFNNNYLGLRNRLAILSEAYAYASFEERVLASLYFAQEVLDYSASHAQEIRELVRSVEERDLVGDSLSVQNEIALTHAEPVEILMGEVEEGRNPAGRRINVRVDTSRAVPMWEYGSFAPTEWARVPAAYLIPPPTGGRGGGPGGGGGRGGFGRGGPSLDGILDRLESHGVPLERLESPRTLAVEEFVVDSTRAAANPFQNVNERTVWGSYRTVTRELPAGTVVIPMQGPHARLAFYLLEPRSDDGFLDWALLDPWVESGSAYPVLRVHEPIGSGG